MQPAPPPPAAAPANASSPPPPTELVPAMRSAFEALMTSIFKPTAATADVVSQVQTFLVAAKQAELYLHSWTLTEREEQLRDDAAVVRDIARLEAELERKAALLSHYGALLREWAERYRRLEDNNERLQEQLYAAPQRQQTASIVNTTEGQRR